MTSGNLSFIHKRQVLEATQNGLLWFQWYATHILGKDLKKTANSYRNGSLSIYKIPSGLWACTRHSTGDSGTLFNFVATIYQLDTQRDFQAVLEQIVNDLNLVLLDQPDITAKKVLPQRAPKDAKKWLPNEAHPLKQRGQYLSAIDNQELLTYFKQFDVAASTLEHYHVKQAAYTKQLNSERKYKDKLTVIYQIAPHKTIKVKRPYAPKKAAFREFYLQNTGNYVFGHDQLPAQCAYILICEGEKDTLLVNQHFNKYGIYAICFHSVSANINTGYLEQLRKKAKHGVFTCFDNDIAGKKFAVKNAELHGIPFLNIASYTAENDLCDIYEKEGLKSLANIFSKELATKTAIPAQSNNPFSIAIPEALSIDVDTFLTEEKTHPQTNIQPLECLKKYLIQHKKAIVQAPTGSGKTTAILALGSDKDFIQSCDVDRLIICVPYQILAKQLAKNYSLPCILQGTNALEIATAAYAPITVCTYNSLKKIAHLIEDACLVIDEFHNLKNQASFRKVACTEVFELMDIAPRTVCLSATPMYELAKYWNYHFIKVDTKHKKAVQLQPIVYNQTSANAVLNHAFDTNDDKIHIVKLNDIKLLQVLKEQLKLRYQLDDEAFTVFYSEGKDDNIEYANISEKGLISDKIKFVLTTSIINDGVNINNPNIGDILLMNEYCTDSLVQFIARFRKATQLNVYVYRKASRNSPYKGPIEHTTSVYKQIQKEANLQLERINHYENIDLNKALLGISLDDFPFVYWSKLHGAYRVDDITLLYKEYIRKRATTNINDFFADIQQSYPNIVVEDLIYQESTSNKALCDTLKLKRSELRLLKDKTYDLITKQPSLFLEAVYHTSQDTLLKKRLQKVILINKQEISIPVKQFILKHASIFSARTYQEVSNRFVDLRLRYQLPMDAIPKLLNKYRTNKAYGDFTHFIAVGLLSKQYRINKAALTPEQCAEVVNSKKIIRSISQLKQEQRCFSKERIRQLISQVTEQDYLTANKALRRLKGLFELEKIFKKQKGKRVCFYRIKCKRDFTHSLSPFDINCAEWLNSFKL